MNKPISLITGEPIIVSTATAARELAATADDLLMLAEVVEAGGFSAASARSGIAKSHLSRRIAALEQQLGVPLINRTSRHFEVTETGAALHEQALRIREATRNALTIAADSGAGPGGVLRVACPIALAAMRLSQVMVEFARRHPRVRLVMGTTNGLTEIEAERYDLIIHPSNRQLPDSDLVAQRLSCVAYGVFASPALLERAQWTGVGGDPHGLEHLPAIGWNTVDATTPWTLEGPDGKHVDLRLAVSFSCDNLLTIREAALAGIGIARLPVSMCSDHVLDGRLVRLAPSWAPPPMSVYALYLSRRRLSLAAQAFIEVLRETFDEIQGEAAAVFPLSA